LDFLEALSRNQEIDEPLEQLHAYSWCDRREREGLRYYELHQLVRELVQRRRGARFVENLIDVVDKTYSDEEKHFGLKDRWFPQLEEAFKRAQGKKDERLTHWVGALYRYCRNRGYGEFYLRLCRSVETLFPEDRWALSNSYSGRALILKARGELDAAMELHKKDEKLKIELGDRVGLAISWWNQGCVHEKKGAHHQQAELWDKAIQLNKSMGIPTEEDEGRVPVPALACNGAIRDKSARAYNRHPSPCPRTQRSDPSHHEPLRLFAEITTDRQQREIKQIVVQFPIR